MNREDLVEAIDDFFSQNEKGGLSEKQSDLLIAEIVKMTPNSDFADIVFYGERDRTAEEVADEALLREEIFQEGGRAAVNTHIEKQYRSAFDDPDTPLSSRFAIVQILEGIVGEELPAMREAVTKAHAAEFGRS